MDYKTDILLNSERDLETAIKTSRKFEEGVESVRVDTHLGDEYYTKSIKIKDDLIEIKKIRAIEIESIGKHILKVNNWSDAFREVLKYLIAMAGTDRDKYKDVIEVSIEKIGMNEDFPLPHGEGWAKMPVGKDNILRKIRSLFDVYGIDLEKVTVYGE